MQGTQGESRPTNAEVGLGYFAQTRQSMGSHSPGPGRARLSSGSDSPPPTRTRGKIRARRPGPLPPRRWHPLRHSDVSPECRRGLPPRTLSPGCTWEDGDDPAMPQNPDSTDFGCSSPATWAIELDDGVEVFACPPADVLVQNGTRHVARPFGGCAGHGWLAFIIGAHRRSVFRP